MRRIRSTRLATLLLLLTASLVAQAAELPTAPLLRLETGMHLAPITRGSGDAGGRWLLTASEDKTARLWDARTGEPRGILRPPASHDSSGALYAAALSPDGRLAALGGNSAFGGSTHSLYLFDPANSRLPPRHTLSGLEAPLTQLAWSADSRQLAIGLRQSGLRLFGADLGFIFADPEYNDAIYGAEFFRDGRLAVASLDGAIRLYAPGRKGMQRIARQQTGQRPYQISWSPDGRSLAVGLQDRAAVLILDAGTLTTQHVASLAGSGNLGRVAWSGDGQTLYAAGSASDQGSFAVFAFPDGGRGPARIVARFGNTVTHLSRTPAGLLATSADPAWKLIVNGQVALEKAPQGGDFRDSGSRLRSNADGSRIVFPFRSTDSGALAFDLARGELLPASPDESGARPKIPAGLRQWRNSPAPQFDDRPLPLTPGEMSRSAVQLPDGESFALGSDWHLRAFSGQGQLRWTSRVPAAVWGLTASGDGRWLIAALGDGSLRWYRSQDGSEQLALFVHADRERWVVWSPGGYYDTSIGGEALLGWHLNRKANQAADFFSLARFREVFYQPRLLQDILPLGSEAAALTAHRAERQAVSASLPPVIDLQGERSIETTAPKIAVRYTLRTPDDAPASNLKVRVNGKLERQIRPRALRAAAGEPALYEIQVPLPARDAEILLMAENRHAQSDPVTLSVRRPANGDKPLAPEKFDTLYLLVVAVDKYPGANALQLPVKDARDFRQQMQRIANPPAGKTRLYERLQVQELVDQQATQENIRAGLRWLEEKVTARDAGVIFLAGHGQSQDNAYYFIPFRADDIGQPAHWIGGSEIVATLHRLPGRAMFFLDTCHAGALANQARIAGTINRVEDERGVIVFASSTPRELAQETDEWGNGAFTKALIEGLRGGAGDPRDQLIYPSTLRHYVTKRVRQLTDNQQRPYISDHGVDDPIATVVK